jgi:hypothetical protein
MRPAQQAAAEPGAQGESSEERGDDDRDGVSIHAEGDRQRAEERDLVDERGRAGHERKQQNGQRGDRPLHLVLDATLAGVSSLIPRARGPRIRCSGA